MFDFDFIHQNVHVDLTGFFKKEILKSTFVYSEFE